MNTCLDITRTQLGGRSTQAWDGWCLSVNGFPPDVLQVRIIKLTVLCTYSTRQRTLMVLPPLHTFPHLASIILNLVG